MSRRTFSAIMEHHEELNMRRTQYDPRAQMMVVGLIILQFYW